MVKSQRQKSLTKQNKNLSTQKHFSMSLKNTELNLIFSSSWFHHLGAAAANILYTRMDIQTTISKPSIGHQ